MVMDEFSLKVFINYFISSYYVVTFIISIGLYTFINTIKHPLKNNLYSPLQENTRGVIVGLGSIIYGIISLYWRLSDKDYPWLHDDIENQTWEKYTALTILVLSLGRLFYLFFFENFKEKERFRLIIVLVCCVLLITTSVWNLMNFS